MPYRSDGLAQMSEQRRRGTRVIWRRQNCLKPNLQTTKGSVRRKDIRCRRHALQIGRSGSDVRAEASWDPRDMAKAELLEAQSPDDERERPPERHPMPAPCPTDRKVWLRCQSRGVVGPA